MKERRTDRLYVKPAAINDLENIYRYTTRHFGHARARQYIETINTAFQRIQQHPQIGRDVSALHANTRMLAVAKHRVFYKSDPERLTVIRVLHESMLANLHLPDEGV